MSADLKSDCEKVLVALGGAARLSRKDIYHDVFGRHRTREQLEAIGERLEADGRILRMRIEPEPGERRDKPIEVWEVKAPKRTNGSGPVVDNAPPPGDGWLPKAKTLRRAQRGVVPAVAARAGRLIRKRQAKNPKVALVSDEQRGATHLVGVAYRSYLKAGIIEVQGDWIRLVKNPTRRPPRHWYESLLYFLAEGHPTLDGKWRRKPKKTLVGLMEDALGRKLEPHERVRRFPGFAGSWNPQHILLYDSDQETITTLADIREEAE